MKQKKYASRFIEEIRQHKEAKLKTYERTLDLYKQGLDPETIALQRSFNTDTIYGHLLKAFDLGEPIPIEDFLSMKNWKK